MKEFGWVDGGLWENEKLGRREEEEREGQGRARTSRKRPVIFVGFLRVRERVSVQEKPRLKKNVP